MGIGMAVTSVGTTLIVHAIGSPLIFALVSWSYFSRFGYTAPLQTAIIFLSVVLVMDIFVAGLLIQGNLDMFMKCAGHMDSPRTELHVHLWSRPVREAPATLRIGKLLVGVQQ